MSEEFRHYVRSPIEPHVALSPCTELCRGLLSLLSVGILTASLPAQATLLMSGEVPHAAVWQRVYDDMAPQWKNNQDLVVQEVSDDAMEKIVAQAEGNNNRADDNSIVDGCYHDASEKEDLPATITLRASLRGEDAELVFAHEYGHFVWDTKITSAQRARYHRLWRDQKRAGHLITRYAANSEEEGFAEAFSYFVRKPAVLHKKDAASWKFFTGLLTTPS